MTLSLLDWLGVGGDDAEKATDAPLQIDLTRDIERGWPIHPADADALTGAFNALGFLSPAQRGDSQAPDDALFSAIERFQEANGLAPSGSMGRGGMTILHLNKALGTRKRAAPPGPLMPLPESTSGNWSFADMVRARRARDAWRANPLLQSSGRTVGAEPDARRSWDRSESGIAPEINALASGSIGRVRRAMNPSSSVPRNARFVPAQFAPSPPPLPVPAPPWVYVMLLILELIALGLMEAPNNEPEQHPSPGDLRRGGPRPPADADQPGPEGGATPPRIEERSGPDQPPGPPAGTPEQPWGSAVDDWWRGSRPRPTPDNQNHPEGTCPLERELPENMSEPGNRACVYLCPDGQRLIVEFQRMYQCRRWIRRTEGWPYVPNRPRGLP